jgi:hypothetical protein
MNLQENISRIKEVMGLITEQSDVISKYVSDPRLISILKQIESDLGDKFTEDHFEREIAWSGGVKKEAGGLFPEVVKAFNKMRDEVGCTGMKINNNISYRTYEDQKKQFLEYAKKKTIDIAMEQAAIPGFSAHHTGKAIDYYQDGAVDLTCLLKKAWPNGDYGVPNRWGFSLPYMSGNIRKKEPWHLNYEGTNNTNIQTPTNNVINITDSDLSKFAEKIASGTSLKSLDLSSIKLDVDKKTFSANLGKTPVYKLVLRWNVANEPNCVSCENTITKNPEYNPEVLKNVRWEDNTRIANLIVLYPKTQ